MSGFKSCPSHELARVFPPPRGGRAARVWWGAQMGQENASLGGRWRSLSHMLKRNKGTFHKIFHLNVSSISQLQSALLQPTSITDRQKAKGSCSLHKEHNKQNLYEHVKSTFPSANHRVQTWGQIYCVRGAPDLSSTLLWGSLFSKWQNTVLSASILLLHFGLKIRTYLARLLKGFLRKIYAKCFEHSKVPTEMACEELVLIEAINHHYFHPAPDPNWRLGT